MGRTGARCFKQRTSSIPPRIPEVPAPRSMGAKPPRKDLPDAIGRPWARSGLFHGAGTDPSHLRKLGVPPATVFWRVPSISRATKRWPGPDLNGRKPACRAGPFPCHETRPALLGSPTGGEQALPFRDEPARSPQSPPESVVPEARAPELRGSAGTASGGHIQEPRQERNRDGDQSEPWGHPLGGG